MLRLHRDLMFTQTNQSFDYVNVILGDSKEVEGGASPRRVVLRLIAAVWNIVCSNTRSIGVVADREHHVFMASSRP